MKWKDWLIAFLCGTGLLLGFWIFADLVKDNQSELPLLLIAVFVIAIYWFGHSLSSWNYVTFSLTAQFTALIGYKIISIVSVIRDIRADGFLADYEAIPYQTVDFLFLLTALTCLLMTAVIRFALTRKKFREIPKKTGHRLFFACVLIVAAGLLNFLSWKAVMPMTEKLDAYCATFSPEKWEKYPPKRELMLPDFLAAHLGESQGEIEALLGQPETEDGYFAGYGGSGELYVSFLYDQNGGLKDVEYVSKSPFGDFKNNGKKD